MKVLFLGDACIDEYRYGNITRVNPESTATLLSYARSEERLGMAHNVAENLIAFGLEVEIQVPTEVSRKIRYIDQRTRHHLLRVDIDCVCKPYEIESTYDFDAIIISCKIKKYRICILISNAYFCAQFINKYRII